MISPNAETMPRVLVVTREVLGDTCMLKVPARPLWPSANFSKDTEMVCSEILRTQKRGEAALSGFYPGYASSGGSTPGWLMLVGYLQVVAQPNWGLSSSTTDTLVVDHTTPASGRVVSMLTYLGKSAENSDCRMSVSAMVVPSLLPSSRPWLKNTQKIAVGEPWKVYQLRPNCFPYTEKNDLRHGKTLCSKCSRFFALNSSPAFENS